MPDTIRALVLVGGPYHDEPGARDELAAALEAHADADLEITDDMSILASEELAEFDVVVVYTTGGSLTDAEEAALAEFVYGGKGLFGLHSATASFKDNALYRDLLGSTFLRHPPFAEVQVQIVDPAHPIARDVSAFSVPDELYVLECDLSRVHLIATARLGDEVQPSAYTRSWGAGRVYYLGLGHNAQCLRAEPFRRLAGQGLTWAAQG